MIKTNLQYQLHEINKAAEFVLKNSPHQVILFDAPMGAGKTTLIKHMLQLLSGDDFLGSPTFSIVHEYNSFQNRPVYHFDLYRLKDSVDLLNIGFEEYFENAERIFIEWPRLALPFLDAYSLVKIRPVDEQTREISIEIP